MTPREQVLGKLTRVPASNFLYAGTVPAFNFLDAGTVPASKHYQNEMEKSNYFLSDLPPEPFNIIPPKFHFK